MTHAIRRARDDDLSGILDVQARCYPDVPLEERASFAAKLDVGPATSFVADGPAGVVGYAIALPWTLLDPPALNAIVARVADCDGLYLHDLAVSPDARGTGAAGRLVEHVLAAGRRLGLSRCGLIAVQGSGAFWARHGFVALANPPQALGAKLRTYAPDAVYMVRPL